MYRSLNFQLFESLLWEPGNGYYLLEQHLTRLENSAHYFEFNYNRQQILTCLREEEKARLREGAKVRLCLDRSGRLEIEVGTLSGIKSKNISVGLAKEPVLTSNKYLYHKTTRREVYEAALKSRPDCDDVILWNEREEITESCRANVVVEHNGVLRTPPVASGLLAGTFREVLLQRGDLLEKVIYKADLLSADRLFTINSVRKWMEVSLI